MIFKGQNYSNFRDIWRSRNRSLVFGLWSHKIADASVNKTMGIFKSRENLYQWVTFVEKLWPKGRYTAIRAIKRGFRLSSCLSLLNLCWYYILKTTFFVVSAGEQWIVFKHWFTCTTPLNFTRFKGIIRAFSGMCVRLTSVPFPVI